LRWCGTTNKRCWSQSFSITRSPSDLSPHIRRFALAPRFSVFTFAYIREHRRTPLTLSEFVDGAYHRTADLPERPIVVTFDDGYADFYDNALRAHLEFELPATLYVTTGHLHGREHTAAHTPPGAMLDVSQLRDSSVAAWR
jgi:peptidoglycan/xylan/chitin deacetylase (PgdA/CDA1 family)